MGVTARASIFAVEILLAHRMLEPFCVKNMLHGPDVKLVRLCQSFNCLAAKKGRVDLTIA